MTIANRVSVAADLTYLREYWADQEWSPCPDDACLSFGSRVIRRLLFDSDLGVLWTELGLASTAKPEPLIVANRLEQRLAPGVQYLALADGEFEVSSGLALEIVGKVGTNERSFTVSEFRDAVCVFISGICITRADLVTYFAEYAAGVHVEPVDAREIHHRDLIARIGQVEGRATVFQSEALRHELRSMARRIIESSDLLALEAAIRGTDNKIHLLVPPRPQPSMMPELKVSMIQDAVCAIGHFLRSPTEHAGDTTGPSFVVRGTGFLVRPTTVFTTRRVIRLLRAEVEAGTLKYDDCRIAFIPRNAASPKLCRIGHFGWVPQHALDIAVLEVVPSDAEYHEPAPLQFSPSVEYHIGKAVAIVGFGFSGIALTENGEPDVPYISRIGPILQSGFVSAVAPYETSKTVERLLLDLRAAEAMAGAPVVDRETGLGVGMHYRREGLVTAFALPLDDQAVKGILAIRDSETDAAAQHTGP